MKKNYAFVAVLLLGLLAFACTKKKENIEPSISDGTDKKGGRYIPLAVGNSWTYTVGDFEMLETLKITSEKYILGRERYVLSNDETENVYMHYDGNKYYEMDPESGVERLMLDEDASIGVQWIASEPEDFSTEYYNNTLTFKGKKTAVYASCKIGGATYNDVVEVEMVLENFLEFTPAGLTSLDAEERETLLAEAALYGDLTTKVWYAKNIGLIFKTTKGLELIDQKLSEYTLK